MSQPMDPLDRPARSVSHGTAAAGRGLKRHNLQQTTPLFELPALPQASAPLGGRISNLSGLSGTTATTRGAASSIFDVDTPVFSATAGLDVPALALSCSPSFDDDDAASNALLVPDAEAVSDLPLVITAPVGRRAGPRRPAPNVARRRFQSEPGPEAGGTANPATDLEAVLALARRKGWIVAWSRGSSRYLGGKCVEAGDGPLALGGGTDVLIVVHYQGQDEVTKELIRRSRMECAGRGEASAIFVVWLDVEISNDAAADRILEAREAFCQSGADDVLCGPRTQSELRFALLEGLARFGEKVQAMRRLGECLEADVQRDFKEDMAAAVEHERCTGLFWQTAGRHMLTDLPAMKPGAEDSARLGALIGPCRLKSELGRGSFGKVFSALNTETSGPEAVKVIAKGPITTLKRVSALCAELRMQQGLQHDHIVRQLGVIHSVRHIAIRMEDAGPMNLFAFMNEWGILPMELARRFHRQVAGAVAYCHGQGIAHRDLKPENIAVNADRNNVKVLDFGCSTWVDERCEDIAGSFPFMAPEVYSCGPGAPYAPAGLDIWSQGVILLEMLCGVGQLSRMLGWGRSTPIAAIRAEELATYFSDAETLHLDIVMATGKTLDEDLSDLFHGTLQVNPAQRWNADRTASCTWLRSGA